jgi:glycosyltransferase involved in cell wall biosynthesis
MHDNLPVLFLITDHLPFPNGMATTKTLYNLLQGYPSDKLVIFSPPGENPENPLSGYIIREPIYFVSGFSNPHIQKRVRKVWLFVNGFIRRIKPLNQWPKNVPKPNIILMATTKPPRVLLAYRYSQILNIPVLPYFLDYWMDYPRLTWGGQNVHNVIRKILGNAKGWLVISIRLAEKLAALYQLKIPALLVLHNPAMQVYPVKENSTAGRLHIAYAGSLWDMHFDAIEAVAKALAMLRKNSGIDAKLIIYTSEAQWQYRKKWFEESQAVYGGFLGPVALMHALRQSDVLLVTASFSESQRHFTECSLQTKVTEYMGSGVPILSIGPDYGECNRFFRENQCGCVIQTIDTFTIAYELNNIIANPKWLNTLTKKALEMASNYYSKSSTQARFVHFLQTNAFRCH